ncbi:MAG TPA: cytochrome c biogenesis protein CcdA [Candidatus Udaeobacter sp.]|jgi:thiol:disulfide interchange protein DsbD|nr:cytochrome c biogenesis protein CcdA [Candidatus Udaeobacter sp.]
MRRTQAAGRGAILGIVAAGTVLFAGASFAQFGALPKPEELVKAHAAEVRVEQDRRTDVVVTLVILDHWHINAHPAASENAIPTDVTIEGSPGIEVQATAYPAPHVVKLPIDDQPLKVWDGRAEIHVPLQVSKSSALGAHTLKGTVRFQACNDQVCLPPASLAFDARIDVVPPGGAGPGASAGGGTREAAPSPEPETTQGAAPAQPPSSSTFATAPPAGAAQAPSPLASSPLGGLGGGGWKSFLALFAIGLALNLTPCVYPMLGVTVSIFGARRAAPPLKVFGSAALYVLGMAVMYSSLGLAAAFTGGLFGGWLANPVVSIAIGLLLIALSLSMFGLYELNPPAALLTRLGGAGATSALGIFLSGLVVGVFAAPCVGPPVVALLAVVGQKGDPWFGFISFFILALGLGAPYLVLGTFSNLLQRMPRSGEWMVWVKKLFGVILFSIGLNYALIAIAPRLAGWVLPAALVVGGLWLGFLDRLGSARPAFRAFARIVGALAIVCGIGFVATTPRHGLEFQPITSLELASRAGDQPYVIDFSADWCQPCHELERVTFADRRVIDAMHAFKLYKVDLTRFDSPEADHWRRQFGIHGVPTIVFAHARGEEVREARVEGFMPPEEFLRRVARARDAVAAIAR